MGLKTLSKQFRDSISQLNLITPPDIVSGLSDIIGVQQYQMYRDALGKDTTIKTERAAVKVIDPGNLSAISVAPRELNLNKNLTTPKDVLSGINNTSPSASAAQQYLGGRGSETVIRSNSVINPGTIDDYSDVQIKKLLSKNIVRNQNDPSESDDFVFGQGYSYTSLISGIGKPTTINDYNVSNLASVSLVPNITTETQLNLSLQQNRYIPVEPNEFEVTVNLLESFREPYVNLNTGLFSRYQPQEYQPSQFIGSGAATGTIGALSSGVNSRIKSDTVLAQIAAMELKFNFENRIANAIERETIGKTYLDEALTNPLTAIQILQDPKNNLFERNWQITEGANFISKAASFVGRLSGVELPVSIIPSDPIYMPGNFSNVNKTDSNDEILRFTGPGQRHALQANLAFNKYTPIFSKIRNNKQYIGYNDINPTLLNTASLVANDYEFGLKDEEFSKYGKLSSNFTWVGSSTKVSSKISETSSYSKFNLLFKTYSLLDNTQVLLNNLDDETDVAKTAIDQTKKKFFDGYKIISRGSGVLGVNIKPPLEGSDTKNSYNIPNISDAELCRVWTKERPYSKVSDSIRFKQLIRKERNSVIDANGNYNIFPTQINVNEGYGRPGSGIGDATVEAFGEKRARKYMFSLENLAWRGSSEFSELPFCEKGSNGGRIMWFPPYDITFSEDNTANWSTHSFLGRPEPLYTFNNTERSGTLSFKIVVDHPSILNTLVKYELKSLTDQQVDEVLASFWSGCVEYDIFELARLWGQLSDQDIRYFKDVLADLDPTVSNAENIKKNESVINNPISKTDNRPTPTSNVNNYSLYFENDVPFEENAWSPENKDRISTYFNSTTERDDYFKIKPFNYYFENYKKLALNGSAPVSEILNGGKLNTSKIFSAAALKSVLYPNNREFFKNNADFQNYSKSIGAAVSYNGGDNYFYSDKISAPYWGFNKQKDAIESELSDNKFNGFDLLIDLTAYSSPINESEYNKALADRRFKSAAIWIATVALKDRNPTKNDVKITVDNVDSIFNGDVAEFMKNGTEKVTITKKINGETLIDSLTKEFFIKGDTFKVNYDNKEYNCFTKKGVKITNLNTDGRLDPEKGLITQADLLCTDLSIVASRARRVDIKITAKPITRSEEKIPSSNKVTKIKSEPLNNVTKREIAQRLLNKLVTECDYFEYLKDESPTVYNTLQSKLKYFLPGFHSMTPEGLNSRLTFLQQCLRPGETIRTANNCTDAVNTSFGKPPICVLRIGDFYNTKIAIQNLNISYDPMIWDLNPEGIGAQPMIASVSLSFKYIGGSGLRKYVEQLQNALSFNYYANADMYDERTFANRDLNERNLINLEQDFFNGDILDLNNIVDLERIQEQKLDLGPDKSTMIGKVLNYTKRVAGGLPGLLDVEDFEAGTIYATGALVKANNLFYKRSETDNGVASPITDNKAWVLQPLLNYGEKALLKEYSSSVINYMDVDYKDVFQSLYQNYIESLGSYVGLYKNFVDTGISPVMLNFLMKQKYGSENFMKKKVGFDDFNTNSDQVQPGFNLTDKTSIFNAYKAEALERNYKPYHELGSFKTAEQEIMRLHLYPNDKLYKITDGSRLDFPTGKINPGPLKSIYLKDQFNVFDKANTRLYFEYHLGTLEQKINHDMTAFISQNESVFNNYVSVFYKADKDSFREYLIDRLFTYYITVENAFETSYEIASKISDLIVKTTTDLHKLSVVLNGSDGLGDKIYAEVVPNGKTISSDVERLFGYDPYKYFPIVNFETSTDGGTLKGNSRVYNFSEIKAIIQNKDNDYKKFFRLGNGDYYFKQVTNNNDLFNNNANGPIFIDNSLPYLKELNDGISLNSNDLNVFNRTFQGSQNGVIVQDINGVDGNPIKYETPTKMSSVFEKLNYEMLDFSNKTLSIMMNDTIADTSTTFDTIKLETGEVRDSLSILLNNLGMVNYTDVLNTVVGENNLYPFNFIPGDGILSDVLETLNEKISFDFKITKSYVDDYNSNLANTALPETIINSKLSVNFYDEILLLGFYEMLLADGVEALAEEFSNILNVDKVVPKAGLNGFKKKEYIKNMTEKRKKCAVELANQLDIFVSDTKLYLTGAIDKVNNNKIKDFSKNIRKILFNEDNNTIFTDLNYSAAADSMLKMVNGTEYTLLMRQTALTDDRTKTLLNKLYK